MAYRTELLALVACSVFAATASAQEFPGFKHHTINPEAGTGLAVTVDDINGDGRLDIVGVSSRDVAWYENPTWERHLMTDTLKGSNVCIAGADLDGDGTTEFALGADWQFNNTESGGALFLLKRRDDPEQPWEAIELLSEQPTLHRIRWADVDGDGKEELIVAPLKGIGSTPPHFADKPAKLFLLRPGDDPFATPWREEVISESLHVMHNIWPTQISGTTPRDAILAASYEGVTLFLMAENGSWGAGRIVAGNPEPQPNSGSGEIKYTVLWQDLWPREPVPPERSRMTYDVNALATIEPWHGHQVVVHIRKSHDTTWNRYVLDDEFDQGHAVWWADFDQDGTDELLAGYRGNAGPRDVPGLNVYDLHLEDSGELTWTKHIVDDGGMATEDALAADINGDGWPDIVAYGRATHNIKYYENLGGQAANSE